MPLSSAKRDTSRGIVIKDGAVLLIERWRTDDSGKELHYFSVPGGKIEQGETPEIAVVRELFEETSLIVRPVKLLASQKLTNGNTNAYYLCDYLSGGPKLHPSAEEKQSSKNRSKPRWVTQDELENLELNAVYEPIRQLIVGAFIGDLPENPLRIK